MTELEEKLRLFREASRPKTTPERIGEFIGVHLSVVILCFIYALPCMLAWNYIGIRHVGFWDSWCALWLLLLARVATK